MARYVKPVALQSNEDNTKSNHSKPIKLSENLTKCRKTAHAKKCAEQKQNRQQKKNKQGKGTVQAKGGLCGTHVISQKTRVSGTLMWSHCI